MDLMIYFTDQEADSTSKNYSVTVQLYSCSYACLRLSQWVDNKDKQ